MSEQSDQRVTEIEKRLDAAAQTLSELGWLTAGEAERIGGRIDRISSQLVALSPSARGGSDRVS